MYIISAHLTGLPSPTPQSRDVWCRAANGFTYTASLSLVSWGLNRNSMFFYGNLISKKVRRKKLMAFFLLSGVQKKRDFAFRVGLKKKNLLQVLQKQASLKLYPVYSKGFPELSRFLRIVNSRFFWKWEMAPENSHCYIQLLAREAVTKTRWFLMSRGHLQFPGGRMPGSTCV